MKIRPVCCRARAGTLASRGLAGAIAMLLASRGLAGAIAMLLASPAASAAGVTWDVAPGTVGAGDGLVTGGSGVWDQTLGNWTIDSGATNIAWTNSHNDTATFGGVAGTVTLTTAITVGGLTFNGAAYSITGGTLTFGSAGAITTTADASITSIVAGTGEITKAGSGTLTLSGANTYDGLTTISAGTLRLGAAGSTPYGPLGSVAAGTRVTATGAALDLNGMSLGTAEALSLVGSGVGGTGALTNNSTTAATYPGTVSLGVGGASIGGAGDITLAAGLAASVETLTKVGSTSTLTLSAGSNRSGPVVISQGTLKVGANGTMGSGFATNTVTVNTGGALDLNGVNYATPSALTLNGTGILSGGALSNSSAAPATYAGLISLGSDASIVANNGNIIISNPGTITGDTFGLTLGGTAPACVLAGIVGVNYGSLTKLGSGTWTLTGASTILGTTTISAGKLAYGVNDALGTGAVKITGGTLDISTFTDSVGAVTVSSGSIVGTTGVLSAKSFDLSGTGSITAKLAGTVSTTGLSKWGPNPSVLTCANTFTGGVNLYEGGSLQLNGATGSLAPSCVLTIGVNWDAIGGGTFILDNVGATGPVSQALASMWIRQAIPNEATVQLVRTAPQNLSLTFTAVTNNALENGNTLNFVTTDTAGGGVNGTHYKFVLGSGLSALIGTGASSYYNIVYQNAYFNSASFAVYDPAGYVRGIKYGTDAGSATSAGGPSFAATNNQEITGPITAQPTTTLGSSGSIKGTLKISGASNLTLQNNAVLTFAADAGKGSNTGASGILKTGGGAATISGSGTARVTLSQVQGDIRVDGPTDVLEITANLTLASNTRFMKCGAGRLLLSGNHTYVLNGAATTGTAGTTIFISGGVLELGGSATFAPSSADNTQCSLMLGSSAAFNYTSSSTTSAIVPIIQGPGSLTVSGSGTLALLASNEFTGQLTVAAGTLQVPTVNSPATDGPLGNNNLPVILGASGASTGTLQYTGASAGSLKNFALAAGGTGAFQIDSAGTTLTLSGDISGGGGLRKIGAGSLTLTGNATYSGDTVVSKGVLAISSPYLADSSTVSIGSGAWLALNTAGATDTVAKLFIDGVQMRAGTYGSTASGATYQDDTTFAGNGRLNVLSGPPAGSAYDTWATTTHGLSGGAAAFDSDYDHDGIANGLEWLFGGDPTRNDSQLIRPTMSGSPAGGLTVVFSRARSSITETTLVVEWGSALGALSNSVVIGSSSVGPNGIRPTVDIDVPAAGQVTVHIPAANAAGGKLFARLKATRP